MNQNHLLPRLSPCGKQLAYFAPFKTYQTIWLQKEDGTCNPLVTNHTHPLAHYKWSQDGKYILFLADDNGNENWNLFRADCATGAVTNLTPHKDIRVHTFHTSPLVPEKVAVVMNLEDQKLYSAYTIDITTGETTLVGKNNGSIKSWIFDRSLFTRGKVTAQGDGSFDLWSRSSADDTWKHHITWNSDDNFTSGPLWFTQDGSHLYITDSRYNDTAQLFLLELATNTCTPLLHDDTHDIRNSNLDDLIPEVLPTCSAYWEEDGNRIGALSYYKTHLSWKALTKKGEEFLAPLEKHYKDKEFWISDATNKETYIIGSCSDTQPPHFEYYHLASGTISPVWPNHTKTNNAPATHFQEVTFTSRDGLTIHGYLTQPQGITKAPLVVRIHGGPWARCIWDYDHHAHVLAQHGFSCLQINYRGSTGYGKKFVNAGNKAWTTHVLDDIDDAIAWACANGIADENNVSCMGRSFGGYLTLMHAGTRPKRFRCIISEVAPTSLHALLSYNLPPYWTVMAPNFYQRIGNPHKEKAYLDSVSPLAFTKKIADNPLLLMHGKGDGRVHFEQAEEFVHSMKKEEHANLTYILFENEGHRNAKQTSLDRYYSAVLNHLKTHMDQDTHTA